LGGNVSELLEWSDANFSQKLSMTLHDLSQWRTLLKMLSSARGGIDEVTAEDKQTCWIAMDSSFPVKIWKNWLKN
jgi:hypothetical protein